MTNDVIWRVYHGSNWLEMASSDSTVNVRSLKIFQSGMSVEISMLACSQVESRAGNCWSRVSTEDSGPVQ